ncbi:bifunctional 4-hydroxy-2-oxoglutarate aldolase/2-dehydro-3-deoxy-phosphogluconate aldolase [Halobacillus sp. ACCC02827]|uniref:bifunctional 4-hydroxy-2-oxoglutarate aldolase/2-dehydro-3-deoxy-phosphogluconate aldolase n=1 Tax=Halobacillus sp. ACCC02827 TaxID=3052090 RepID=UPI0025709009|nr:bifunctional 4-hydroxy-2-oxoglutarate aldolase/2-dehydro-3-deoxy-phosphogluconate aldolase [Halobacillus sp. ACCC02827]WJE14191.1 bifunctional 4-hydroxy-2-oxoglutarate aldolase/2-dehydro-3-deoxy-phosphogluconate aldolase [Halobacillus sp. ACCC02827]
MQEEILNKLCLTPVIRGVERDKIVPITEALLGGGIKAVEITAETPGAAAMIADVKKEFGTRMLVGAGTVLDPETAKEMIASGAEFIVSPGLNIDTIKLTHRYRKLCVPGVLTPTEISQALTYGVAMVKVFPAHVMGPQYIKSLKGPFPDIKVMATGGIHLGNMEEYLTSGADAVGIGSQLVRPSAYQKTEDYTLLEQLTEDYVSMVKKKINLSFSTM